MNNTDKLLRAFIEASGYEIEEVGGGVSPARRKELEDNNMLFTLAVEDVIDYKVTKLEDNYFPLVGSGLTREQRVHFIDKEICVLTRRRERIINEKV